MDVNSVADVALGLVAGLGGGGVIAGGIFSLFGKHLAERFLAQQRAKHERELETLKSGFERELEHYRSELNRVSARFERYDARQFETYGQIWAALYELKLAADALWEKASPGNLARFGHQFQDTSSITGKLSLYIEDEHYRKLRELLLRFGDFEVGKQRLYELKNPRNRAREAELADIGKLISLNGQFKMEYDALIERIQQDFRAQLRMPINSSS